MLARVVDRSADEKARRGSSYGHEVDVTGDDRKELYSGAHDGIQFKGDRLATNRSLRPRPSKRSGKDTGLDLGESLDPASSLPTGRTIRRKKAVQTLDKPEPRLPPTPTALTRHLDPNEPSVNKRPPFSSPDRLFRELNGAGHSDSQNPPVDDLLSKEIGDKALLRNELQAQLGKLQGEVAQLENQAARLKFEDPDLQDEESLRELVYVLTHDILPPCQSL